MRSEEYVRYHCDQEDQIDGFKRLKKMIHDNGLPSIEQMIALQRQVGDSLCNQSSKTRANLVLYCSYAPTSRFYNVNVFFSSCKIVDSCPLQHTTNLTLTVEVEEWKINNIIQPFTF